MLHDLVTWSFSAWDHNTLPLTLWWLLRTNARIGTSSSGVYLASVVIFHVITKGWSIGFQVPPSSICWTVRVLLWDLIGATKSLSEGLTKPPPWFIVTRIFVQQFHRWAPSHFSWLQTVTIQSNPILMLVTVMHKSGKYLFSSKVPEAV